MSRDASVVKRRTLNGTKVKTTKTSASSHSPRSRS